MIDYRKESDDVIYITATYTNTQLEVVENNFSQTRSSNILDKASDYYLTVIRFIIPRFNLSIFNYDNRPMYINIEEGGVSKTRKLPYFDFGNRAISKDNNFRGIYYVRQLLLALNESLELAHNASPASPGNPPIMIYEDDGYFSMIVDDQYVTDTKIYFNQFLYGLFVSLPAEFLSYNDPDHKEMLIYVAPTFENLHPYTSPFTGNYYKMRQETKSQFNWSNIKNIILTTTTMPCNKELISFGQNTSSEENQAISDFIPIEEVTSEIDRANFIYLANDAYRYVDLESDGPLRSVDFKIFLVDDFGIFFPYRISPGETIQVKFMFVKKSLVNNEYSYLQQLNNEKDHKNIKYTLGHRKGAH